VYLEELQSFSEINFNDVEINEIQFFQNRLLDDRNIDEITIPRYSKDLFHNYWNLNEEDLSIFRIGAYQFYQSLEIESINKSLSLTLLVCSIESLIEYEYQKVKPEKCECCGNTIYQVTKKFKEFLHNNNPNSSKEFKKFVDNLYNTRSKILHTGKLLALDLRWQINQPDQSAKEYFLRKDSFIQIRICLINWMMKRNNFA
jgi:hypothetical protein